MKKDIGQGINADDMGDGWICLTTGSNTIFLHHTTLKNLNDFADKIDRRFCGHPECNYVSCQYSEATK